MSHENPFLATLLLVSLIGWPSGSAVATHAENFWDEGELVGAHAFCNTLTQIQRVAVAFAENDAAGSSMFYGYFANAMCMKSPTLRAILVERFNRYQMPDGVVFEVWSMEIEGTIFYGLFMLRPGASTRPGKATPISGYAI